MATGQPVRGSLERLRDIIGVGVRPFAEALPEAITAAAEQRGAAMAAALESTVMETIRATTLRHPDFFGELLSPTIGAAVRMAVAATFAELMQRLNEVLERSVSLEAMRWRLEARRTGIPFAEVVLARVLLSKGEVAVAVELAAKAMVVLESLPAGLEEGESVVRLVRAETLLAAGDLAGARAVVLTARERLMERAAKISVEEWRETFLHGVPDNARTLQLARELVDTASSPSA